MSGTLLLLTLLGLLLFAVIEMIIWVIKDRNSPKD